MIFLRLFQDAVKQAESDLTRSVRKSAYDHGWNSECGRGLSVSCEGSSITVSMTEKAEDKEYGWYEAQPSPAVRHWQNDNAGAGSVLASSIDRALGAVL